MNTLRQSGIPLPPRRDHVEARQAPVRHDLGEVVPSARDRTLEIFDDDALGSELRAILRGSMSGDFQCQQRLFYHMVDKSPHLQKSIAEKNGKIVNAPWKIVPWAKRGEPPTPEAEDVANVVENALWSMESRAADGGMDFEELIGRVADAQLYGHDVIETIWSEKNGGVPVTAYGLPPRFYNYPDHAEGRDRLMLDPKGQGMRNDLVDFDPLKYIVAINKGHPGHAAAAAPMRALLGSWLAMRHGLKWLMGYTERFGMPIRWAEYDSTNPQTKAEVIRMMETIGAAAYGVFPQGTKLNFVANNQNAASLPQVELMEIYKETVAIFVLGQTLTSSAGDKGTQALGTVHEGVLNDVVRSGCSFVSRVLKQLIRAIVTVNYGPGRTDIPDIIADFPEAKDEKAMAERDNLLGITSGTTPVDQQWFYERHNIPLPAKDAILFQPAPTGAPAPGVPDPAKPTEPVGENLTDEEKEAARLKKEEDDKKAAVSAAAAGESPDVAELLDELEKSGEIVDDELLAKILGAAWRKGAKEAPAE